MRANSQLQGVAVLLLAIVGSAAGMAAEKGRKLHMPDLGRDLKDLPQHHHSRLLVTLHDRLDRLPSAADVAAGRVDLAPLRELGLKLVDVIDCSHEGEEHAAATGAESEAEDHLYIAEVAEGVDVKEAMKEALKHSKVKAVELDAIMHANSVYVPRSSPHTNPDDDFYTCTNDGCGPPGRLAPGQLWGIGKIGANRAWKYTVGNKQAKRKVKVGIIDTGISLYHKDLVANTAKKCEDFYNNDHSCDETKLKGGMHGHGTHVAGIIGAMGNNALGTVGVNWHLELIGCTIYPDAPYAADHAAGTKSAAIKCLNWLRNKQGVRIINNSYGCSSKGNPSCFSSVFERTIRQFDRQGGLFVAAAGNDGISDDKVPHYPASYKVPNVLSVAATTNADKYGDSIDPHAPERLASFSDYGNSVHIAAPGENIVSTFAPGSFDCNGESYCYAVLSGTSQAAPYVTGAAALIASMPHAPRGAALKRFLMQTSDKFAWLKGKVHSRGRLNVFNAVYILKHYGRPLVPTKFTRRMLGSVYDHVGSFAASPAAWEADGEAADGGATLGEAVADMISDVLPAAGSHLRGL